MTIYTIDKIANGYKIVRNKKVVFTTKSIVALEEELFGRLAELEKIGCSYKVQNRVKGLSF